MLEEIKKFGSGVTRVEAEQILGYASGTLKAYIHRGGIPNKYLRQSGTTWLISVEWIELKLSENRH